MSHKRYYAKAGWLWLTNLHRKRKESFVFEGHTYPYFNHRYNLTFFNERTVEIPLVREYIHRVTGRVLEVGNVLSCYDDSMRHVVIDKYERPQRQNAYAEDAETFTDAAPYDLIISVSTLEHVGWDESPRDENKITRTINHLRSLLAPGGIFVFTAPVGYSPPLDRIIDKGEGFLSRNGLLRISANNEWKQVPWNDIRSCRFHSPYPFANGLVVVKLGPIHSQA